jgi:hypothetical protein
VKKLLLSKDKHLRDLSKNLFWYDYLDHDEIEKVMKGEKLDKAKVRDWDNKSYGDYVIKF